METGRGGGTEKSRPLAGAMRMEFEKSVLRKTISALDVTGICPRTRRNCSPRCASTATFRRASARSLPGSSPRRRRSSRGIAKRSSG